MAFPVKTVSLPDVLRGQSNGELDPSILVETPGQANGPAVVLVEPAARAWRALTAAAARDGHVLKSSCPFCSYRPYSEQERIFRIRYSTTSTGSSDKKKWLGMTWFRKAGVAAAAAPGTSNHGRGLAVDTGEERDNDAGTESMDNATLKWLVANADRFGWSWEIQSEPWHIRYWAGDTIPQAVLDHEVTDPVPDPVSERKHEEDDIVIIAPHKQVALPVTPSQRILFLTDAFPATIGGSAPGVTARILLGGPGADGVMRWRAPISTATRTGLGELAFIAAGRPAVEVVVANGETNLVVEHLGREPVPLTVAFA